ncbi:MAG: shikimate kinase [Desulfosarcinaceae bacterium]
MSTGNPVKVYFCGMIGSGKTSIGRPLADALKLPFFDLDDEMDKILGYSFHKLVKEKGWVAFRELEYDICKTFARQQEGIFGLGGGTVRYQWNMDILKGTGLMILLTADPEVLIQRVSLADRPRVNRETTLEEDIRLLWKNHRQQYFNAADIHYATDQKEIGQEIAELKEIIVKWHASAQLFFR